jgi:hypothetical protein
MTTVSIGSTLKVSAGQVFSDITVPYGATLDVFGATINTVDQGLEWVEPLGTASGTMVSGAGADQYVYGNASGTTLSALQFGTNPGPVGICFDFKDGCRTVRPEGKHHAWQALLSDFDISNMLFETQIKAGRVNNTKRFIRIRREVSYQDKYALTHDYAAADRNLLVQFPASTVGDTLSWFTYAVKRLPPCREHRTAGYIRGVDPTEAQIALADYRPAGTVRQIDIVGHNAAIVGYRPTAIR